MKAWIRQEWTLCWGRVEQPMSWQKFWRAARFQVWLCAIWTVIVGCSILCIVVEQLDLGGWEDDVILAFSKAIAAGVMLIVLGVILLHALITRVGINLNEPS